jgi:DNA-binding transcriptional regulator LsrR (DeoR family)
MTDLPDTPCQQQYRPADRDTLRAAAWELYGRGLTPRDIAEALGLTAPAVLQLLGRVTPE